MTTPEALRELGQCLKLGGTAVQIKKRTRAGVGVICLIGAIHVHDSALTQGVGLLGGLGGGALGAAPKGGHGGGRTGCQSPQEGEGRPPADPLLELGVVCTVGYKVAAVVEGFPEEVVVAGVQLVSGIVGVAIREVRVAKEMADVIASALDEVAGQLCPGGSVGFAREVGGIIGEFGVNKPEERAEGTVFPGMRGGCDENEVPAGVFP